MKTITSEEKKYFEFLNDLRESGIVNMFGAPPYLAERFNLDRKTSINVVSKWMDMFNPEGYNDLVIKDN